METKTEPVLTKDLINKAADIDVWFVIGALEAVAFAEPGREASMRTAAAKTLTRQIEAHR